MKNQRHVKEKSYDTFVLVSIAMSRSGKKRQIGKIKKKGAEA